MGDEFARQYYNTLQNAPENLYKLYKDKSTISRPGLDGTMRVFTLSVKILFLIDLVTLVKSLFS